MHGFTAGSRCDRSQNRSLQRLVANTSAINSDGCSQVWGILATKVNKL
ncbi:hypothetical protein [Nostoc sp.]